MIHHLNPISRIRQMYGINRERLFGEDRENCLRGGVENCQD